MPLVLIYQYYQDYLYRVRLRILRLFPIKNDLSRRDAATIVYEDLKEEEHWSRYVIVVDKRNKYCFYLQYNLHVTRTLTEQQHRSCIKANQQKARKLTILCRQRRTSIHWRQDWSQPHLLGRLTRD